MAEILAFDVGGTHLRTAIVDEENTVSDITVEDIRNLSFPDIYDRVIALAVEQSHARPTVSRIGISAAGHVDHEAGSVAYHAVDEASAQGGEWHFKKLDIVSQLHGQTGLPVAIENDGNAMALAEWQLGAAQGYDSAVSLNLGTYPASGVILNGKLLRRKTSGILLGATVIDSPAGIHYLSDGVSGHGMFEALKQHCLKQPRSKLALGWDKKQQAGHYLFEQANRNDTDALAIFSNASKSLGLLITTAINVFDPEVITLGGRVMDSYDLLRKDALDIVSRYALPTGNREKCKIIEANFRYTGGLVGAAIAARKI